MTIRTFQTRESAEYRQTLSTLLSLTTPPNSNYRGLTETAYTPSAEVLRKLLDLETADNVSRIINIDYIGMSGSVLLDRDQTYTKNAHFDKLQELLNALESLNKEHGVALRMRILLQYPYSLAGQNRILAETWDSRSFMGEITGAARDETQLAPSLKDNDIQHSYLLRLQAYCLSNLRNAIAPIEPLLDNGPNRVIVRFASISTLLCGLRINSKFFYDPYHYGKRRLARACAMTSTPVAMLDEQESAEPYQAFCNHFQYIWECDSTMECDDVLYQERGKTTLFIKRPEKVQCDMKVKRLRQLRPTGVDWEVRAKQFHQVVANVCPIVGPVDMPEVGFLAAAWEKKPDGTQGLCEPASYLEDLFKASFDDRDDIRVTVLRGELGTTLSRNLFEKLNASSFGIVVLTREIEETYCRPNVYIELGYLLNKNKGQRTFIVADAEMNLATDIQDFIYLPFRARGPQLRHEMQRVYKQLLVNMWQAGIISKSTLDDTTPLTT